MAKIKKENLVKEAETQAHKEIAADEAKNSKSLVQSKLKNQVNKKDPEDPQVFDLGDVQLESKNM